jgi:hypothetical protein
MPVGDRMGFPDAGQTPSLWEFADAAGLHAVVIGTSKVPNAKIVVLLVSPTTGRADFAVKVPTTDVAADAVATEAAVLSRLPSELPEIAQTIPRVVGEVSFHGRVGIVMTAPPGKPMSVAYARSRQTADRRRVAADFAAIERWLSALQSATATRVWPVDLSADIADRLTARFADDHSTRDDLAKLREIWARLETTDTPRTVVHGDLWLSNILLERGAVAGVVDWEGGESCGEPVRDLVRFAVTYALFLDRHTRPGRRVRGHPDLRAGTWGAGVDYALDGRGWFPEIVRGFLQDGLRRLGADPALWRDAALAGIAEYAAQTDDPVFGRSVFGIFRRLAR